MIGSSAGAGAEVHTALLAPPATPCTRVDGGPGRLCRGGTTVPWTGYRLEAGLRVGNAAYPRSTSNLGPS